MHLTSVITGILLLMGGVSGLLNIFNPLGRLTPSTMLPYVATSRKRVNRRLRVVYRV